MTKPVGGVRWRHYTCLIIMRMPEKFDPREAQYKKVEDLPQEHQSEFVNIPKVSEKEGGGFVNKEAMETYKSWEESAKMQKLNRNKEISPLDIGRERAINENEQRDREKKVDEYLEREESQIAPLIREQKIEGLRKLAQESAEYPTQDYRNEEGYMIAEAFAWRVLASRERTGKPYNEILDATADVFTTIGNKYNFQGWSHSLCHLFENYGKGASFLDVPDATAGKLVDEAVRRSIEGHEKGCIDRIVQPIVSYNLDHMDPAALDARFPFKQDSLNNEELASLVRGEYSMHASIFCTANSPREFLVTCVKEKVFLPRGMTGLPPEMVVTFLNAIKNDVTEEEMHTYINKFYRVNDQETTLETLTGNFTESLDASEKLEGVYVDVEGTLITKKEGKLNDRLVTLMEKESTAGKKVVVFSGGAPEEMTQRLRSLGFPEKFLPVVSKNDFRGKVLDEVIDDTIPQYQGFKAVKYVRPALLHEW